jgi:hypothetical protein
MKPPLLVSILDTMLEKYGPCLVIKLPYSLREDAEQAERFVSDVCPHLCVQVEVCGSEWRLVVSKRTAAREVRYDC